MKKSSEINLMGFLNIRILRKKHNTKGHLLIKQNAMAILESFECTELSFALCQVLYKYCDQSFINEPAVLNFVPQLIRKICRWAKCGFIDLHVQ